jgi:iron complex transport system substrate-binding protein
MFRHGRRVFRGWWPLAVVLIAGAVSMGASQAGVNAPAASNVTKGCIDKFDAAKDYFSDKVTIEDAARFDVIYHRSDKVVSVRAAVENPAERYVLVQCGAPPPTLEGDLVGAR